MFSKTISKILTLILGFTSLATMSSGDQELDTYGIGWKGIWLNNDEVKAFVAIEPRLRLLHYGFKDGQNLLRSSQDDISGLKTGYLAPGHKPDSFSVGDQSAAILLKERHRLILKTGIEERSKLSLQWIVELSRTEPLITITHQLRNHSGSTREFAVWSLLAIELMGQIEVNEVSNEGTQVFPLSGPPIGTEAQNITDNAYLLDLGAPIHPYILRTGLFTDSPTFTYKHPEGELHSQVSACTGPWSPPGINLLFYADVSPEESFTELEHLGPLRQIQPDGILSMVQSLKLSRANPLGHAVDPTADQAGHLNLYYQYETGIQTDSAGSVQSWTSLLEKVPVALLPLDRTNVPRLTHEGVQFHGSPVEIPKLAPLQSSPPTRARAVEIRFKPDSVEFSPSPQMLFEIGGNGNGYNLFIRNHKLMACVWGKDEIGQIRYRVMNCPIQKGIITARIEIDPENKEARLVVNGSIQSRVILPAISPHRDRCAMGGVSGSSRIGDIVLYDGDAPFYGVIQSLSVSMYPGSRIISEGSLEPVENSNRHPDSSIEQNTLLLEN